MSALWGFRYGEKLIPAGEEKNYRRTCSDTVFGLTRDEVLAKDPGSDGPVDYYSLYAGYYGRHNLHYE
jgi:hypothetical protein